MQAASHQPCYTAPKTIVYLDRNNTPDIWGDIKKTVDETSREAVALGGKRHRTVVLLPKQERFDKTLYRRKNPICPHLIFECCNRIFKRREHGCLSGENKPKAVEVVLKFAKLHDDFDFDDEEQVSSYFDDVLCLDFMKYAERRQPLLPETISGLIDAYNATPENFGVPSDQVIQSVIDLVDRQMERDSIIEGDIAGKQIINNDNATTVNNLESTSPRWACLTT